MENDSRPPRSPNQNGLAERAVRSLKIGVRNIIAITTDACPCREIITQAVVDKNQAPHSTTGIPPALAMAGRCDVFGGFAHTAFDREPAPADSLWRDDNAIRNIPNSRNAIIMADANNSIPTMMAKISPGRFMDFSTIGSAVQITTDDKIRKGSYRAIGTLRSNLISELAGKVFKWPKCRTRL